MKKDRWIQRAKALLFDFSLTAPEESLREEARELIRSGGGYEADYEDSESSLVWTAQDRQAAEKHGRKRAQKKWNYILDSYFTVARQRLDKMEEAQQSAEPEDWDIAFRMYSEGKHSGTKYFKNRKEIRV